jgi:hypothetical protein
MGTRERGKEQKILLLLSYLLLVCIWAVEKRSVWNEQ